MKKILVIGKGGQLASLIEKTVKSEKFSNALSAQFVGLDEMDITSELSVTDFMHDKNFDYIINCAAYTAVDKAEEETDIAYAVNAEGSKIVAEYCKISNTKLLHVSTDYVFDGTACSPYSEADNTNPLSVYGASKLKGEKFIVDILAEDALVVRTSWLYSELENNFLNTMINLGKTKDEINVVFDQIGTPTYAKDLADTLLSVAMAEDFHSGIFHYSNEGVASWYDFACAIMKLSELDCKVNPVTSDCFPTTAKRPSFSVLNKTKIKSAYSLDIPHWRESLEVAISARRGV
ncbi:MAG: dTDP-4-dehydrorhamnose reductase [Bacteroidales bacterium]